jgi:hypothetical protein
MPIPLMTIASVATGAFAKAKQRNLERANLGNSNFSKPKTVLGKLLGRTTGRTEAYNAQEKMKTNPLSSQVQSSLQARETPITGGFSFGGEATKKTYLPFVIVGGVVGIVYFIFGKKNKSRRRRY